MTLAHTIHTRRSIRRYLDRPVPPALIDQLLDAATWAPSAHNRQPWRFVVIETAAVKAQLADRLGEHELIGATRAGHADGAPRDSSVDAGPDAPFPLCPSSYIAAGSGYYRASGNTGTPETWFGAEMACETDGAQAMMHTHLVVFDDAAEVTAVTTGLGTLPLDNWVGYDDIVLGPDSNGSWFVMTGSPPGASGRSTAVI